MEPRIERFRRENRQIFEGVNFRESKKRERRNTRKRSVCAPSGTDRSSSRSIARVPRITAVIVRRWFSPFRRINWSVIYTHPRGMPGLLWWIMITSRRRSRVGANFASFPLGPRVSWPRQPPSLAAYISVSLFSCVGYPPLMYERNWLGGVRDPRKRRLSTVAGTGSEWSCPLADDKLDWKGRGYQRLFQTSFASQRKLDSQLFAGQACILATKRVIRGLTTFRALKFSSERTYNRNCEGRRRESIEFNCGMLMLELMLPRCFCRNKNEAFSLLGRVEATCWNVLYTPGERDINEVCRQEIARRMLNAMSTRFLGVLESEKSTVTSIFRNTPLEIRC